MNPLWDHLSGFHAYVARFGYALSVGKPLVRTALYYPVRDMWALGASATEAVNSFEALAAELLARQSPYDVVDDDALSTARIEGKQLLVGAMRYDTIICGDVKWMRGKSKERLDAFAEAGGNVLCVNHVPGVTGEVPAPAPTPVRVGTVSEVAGQALPLAIFTPPGRGVRVAARELQGQQVLVAFNEGNAPYTGVLSATAPNAAELDLPTGRISNVAAGAGGIELRLGPGETRAFLLSERPVPGAANALRARERITVAPESVFAVSGKRVSVSEHDFEFADRTFDRVPFAQSADWSTWLTEDYSGEVEYRFEVDVPVHGQGRRCNSKPARSDTPRPYVSTARKVRCCGRPGASRCKACDAGKHTIAIRVATRSQTN